MFQIRICLNELCRFSELILCPFSRACRAMQNYRILSNIIVIIPIRALYFSYGFRHVGATLKDT